MGTFFRLQVYEGKHFTSWSIWKGREIRNFDLWKGPEGLTGPFYGSGFVIYSYFEDNALAAVKRDAKL